MKKSLVLKDSKKKLKILVIPPNGIGDNMMFLPLIYYLKKELNAEIHVLSNKSNKAAEIMERCDYIDKVLKFEFKSDPYSVTEYALFFIRQYFALLKNIRSGRYNYILTINPNILINSILLNFNKNRTIVEKNFKESQYKAAFNLLKQFAPAKEGPDYPKLIDIKDSYKILTKFKIKKPYVCIAPFGNSRSRSYTKYQQLINYLRNKKVQIVMVGRHKDHKKEEEIVDLVNQTTIAELIAVISNSKLMIAVDSGIMHIGIVQKVPIIGLFGSVSSKFRKPLNKKIYFKAYDGRKEQHALEKRIEIQKDKNYMDNINEKEVFKSTLRYLKR